MSTLPDLTKQDLDLVTRSACHTLADAAITYAAAVLRDGVTDFDIARLMLALETGHVIVPAGRTWKVLDVRPVLMPFIPRMFITIEETMRVGLARPGTVRTAPGIVRTQLLAAPVHLRVRTEDGIATACSASRDIPFLRYRTVDDSDLVDCDACLSAQRLG